MSNQTARFRRVPPTRSAVRASVTSREWVRTMARHRPLTVSAARALEG